jgi:hypothetical protein
MTDQEKQALDDVFSEDLDLTDGEQADGVRGGISISVAKDPTSVTAEPIVSELGGANIKSALS